MWERLRGGKPLTLTFGDSGGIPVRRYANNSPVLGHEWGAPNPQVFHDNAPVVLDPACGLVGCAVFSLKKPV